MQPAPQTNPQQAQPQGSPVQAIISQVSEGLGKLMEIFDQANLPPQDKQHLAGIITSFQALIEELSKPQGQGRPAPNQPTPQGPMPANAARGSQPV